MKRTKLYKLIIAALLVINVGMLVFFFMEKPPHFNPPKKGELVRELGLTGEKRTKVIALAKAHHKAKRKLMDADRELHEELFSKIGTDEDVSELEGKIAANFMETEKITFEFFSEVSKYCDSDQKKKLKKMIHHAFRQMRRPPPKR